MKLETIHAITLGAGMITDCDIPIKMTVDQNDWPVYDPKYSFEHATVNCQDCLDNGPRELIFNDEDKVNPIQDDFDWDLPTDDIGDISDHGVIDHETGMIQLHGHDGPDSNYLEN